MSQRYTCTRLPVPELAWMFHVPCSLGGGFMHSFYLARLRRVNSPVSSPRAPAVLGRHIVAECLYLSTRRSQGAGILQPNSPCSFSSPITYFRSGYSAYTTPDQFSSSEWRHKERDKGMEKFSFLSFSPAAVTHPSSNRPQRCLTSVISRELVCQRSQGVA